MTVNSIIRMVSEKAEGFNEVDIGGHTETIPYFLYMTVREMKSIIDLHLLI